MNTEDAIVYGVCLVVYSLDRNSIWTVREKKTDESVAKMAGDVSFPMGRVLPHHDLATSLHRLQAREMGGLLDLKLIQDRTGRMYEKHGLLCVSFAACLQPWEEFNSKEVKPELTQDVKTIGWMKIEEFLNLGGQLRYGARDIIMDLECDRQGIRKITPAWAGALKTSSVSSFSLKI